MDASSFDQLARHLRDRRARRRALPVIAGGLIGVVGLSGTPAAQAKKKKSKKVTLCLNGQTVSVPKKKQGGLLKQGATAGACAAGGGGGTAAPSGCNGGSGCDICKREVCQDGACGCPAEMVRDANGICHTPSSCVSSGITVDAVKRCCSGKGTTGSAPFMCLAGTTQCRASSDCVNGGKCLGGMCPETYLATAGTMCKAGIGCTGPGDCDTGRCRNGVCATCSVSAYCSETQANPCTCNTATGQCIAESESRWIVLDGHNCGACPDGYADCETSDNPDKTYCKPVCGHSFP